MYVRHAASTVWPYLKWILGIGFVGVSIYYAIRAYPHLQTFGLKAANPYQVGHTTVSIEIAFVLGLILYGLIVGTAITLRDKRDKKKK